MFNYKILFNNSIKGLSYNEILHMVTPDGFKLNSTELCCNEYIYHITYDNKNYIISISRNFFFGGLSIIYYYNDYSIIVYTNEETGYIRKLKYTFNDLTHRIDGPAITVYARMCCKIGGYKLVGSIATIERYFLHGKQHRRNGPCIIKRYISTLGMSTEYYIHGSAYSKNKFFEMKETS